MTDPVHPFTRIQRGMLPRRPTSEPTEYEKNFLMPKLPTTPTGVRFMLTLGAFGYGGREIWASVGVLAAAANTTERSVQRLLRDFEHRGWLTTTYKSPGLADATGQRTSKYRLNWDNIRRDAQKTYKSNLQEYRKQQEERTEAFNRTRLGQPSHGDPSRQPKGDKKGDKGPPKGDRMSANLVFHLEEGFEEGELENERSEPNSGQGDVAPCDWDSEFSTETGIVFETLAGKIAIAGDVAERWVGWKQIDGVGILKAAQRYMEQQALIAPDKTALIVFLADCARKVALGFEGHRLHEVLAPFHGHWAAEGRP